MEKTSMHSYIPALNGWRALSILYVLIFHGSWVFFNPTSGLYPSQNIWKVVSTGAFGVYFFFGISGYLITTRLIEEFKFNNRISLLSFYGRRIFRILPILFVFLIVIIALNFFQLIHVTKTGILSSLFLYRNYVTVEGDWFNAHFWSLSLEEHYYLIWPILFYFIVKLKRSWIPVLFILALATGWRMIELRFHVLSRFLPGTEGLGRTDLYLDFILWGSFAAILNKEEKFRSFFYKITRDWMIFFSIIIMHLPLFFTMHLSESVKGVFIQLCLLLTINYPSSFFTKFLEKKWLATIGIYSYSIYVWQQLFLTPSTIRIKGLEILQTPPVNILLIIAMAYLSYTYIETPMINFGKKLMAKRSQGKI